MTVKYKEYMDISTKELKEYEISFKQIENEYNTIKKRKDSAFQEVQKVFYIIKLFNIIVRNGINTCNSSRNGTN
jgi:hypothetical protein